MKNKNKGYILPVAVGVLVIASLGLLLFSWGKDPKTEERLGANNKNASTTSEVKSESSLESDEAEINASLKALDDANVNIDGGINDKSSI